MDDTLKILQANILSALRHDCVLASIVHATHATVATRVALRAVTGMEDGDIRLCDERPTYVGLYLYDADNVTADNDGTYIEPTVGDGCWVKYTDCSTLAWGMTPANGGHVFDGICDQLHRGRNRGRMPLIEVQVGEESASETSTAGGNIEVPVTIRGWYANGPNDAGVQPLRTMLKNAVLGIREAYFNGSQTYLLSGNMDQQPYRDSEWTGPVLTRFRMAVYGDLTLNVKYTYTESDLIS